MVLVSYTGKEINAKLVFYGPGLCGKTTNLEYIYGSIPSNSRGKMVSMKTKTERTLFFDFLPIDLGELAGFKTRFLLYTVPGQVYYNATRKLVLKGVDAVVFVADSGRGKMDENIESFDNLKDNLKEHGLSLDNIPYVLQYNKRDLPDVYTIDEMESALNKDGVPHYEAVATKGDGVFDTFKEVTKMLLAKLSKEIGAPVRKPQQPALPQMETSPETDDIQRCTPHQPEATAPPVTDDLLTTSQDVSLETPPAGEVTQKPENDFIPETEMSQSPAVEPGPEPDDTASDDVAEQKSKGLWRWFKRDETESAEGSPVDEDIQTGSAESLSDTGSISSVEAPGAEASDSAISSGESSDLASETAEDLVCGEADNQPCDEVRSFSGSEVDDLPCGKADEGSSDDLSISDNDITRGFDQSSQAAPQSVPEPAVTGSDPDAGITTGPMPPAELDPARIDPAAVSDQVPEATASISTQTSPVPAVEEISAGTVRRDGNEVTIPLLIPASLTGDKLVIRLELKVGQDEGEGKSDQQAA